MKKSFIEKIKRKRALFTKNIFMLMQMDTLSEQTLDFYGVLVSIINQTGKLFGSLTKMKGKDIMTEFEKTCIETMEMVLLNQYKDIINAPNLQSKILMKAEKDGMIEALSIMGYTVSIDVDTDLRVKAVHVRKI